MDANMRDSINIESNKSDIYKKCRLDTSYDNKIKERTYRVILKQRTIR